MTAAVVAGWIADGVGGMDPDGPDATRLRAGAAVHSAAAQTAAHRLVDALERSWRTASRTRRHAVSAAGCAARGVGPGDAHARRPYTVRPLEHPRSAHAPQ